MKLQIIDPEIIDPKIIDPDDFLEKGLGIVPPPHFENDFSRKVVLMLHSIN